MGAVYFYHLTRTPLEATLPALLSKALAAGWPVAVRGADPARLDWLDEKLWLGDGFLPHGRAGGPFDADQPVLLTSKTDLPNAARCLMTIDSVGVTPEEARDLDRCCILFDGNDPGQVEIARGQWKALADAGCALQYWSQESGSWAKKAETGSG